MTLSEAAETPPQVLRQKESQHQRGRVADAAVAAGCPLCS